MNRVFSVFVAALVVCAGSGAAGQTRSADAGQPAAEAPGPIEQAVIEHRCSASRTTGIAATDDYQSCMRTQLQLLRADFGADMKRLTAAERKTLDSVCSRVRSGEGRDAYVACLSNQLWTLHNRRTAAAPPSSPAPAASSTPAAAAPSAPPAAAAAPRSTALLIGGGVGVLLFVAGGILLLKKRKRVATCRQCGAAFGESGDLCAKCRREAADALRRAAAEREERACAEAEEQRRRAERDEELRRQRALDAENAVREMEARARDEALAREREEERRRDEELRERSQFGVAADVFDPYAVLGVPPGAPEADIRRAYEEARAKYDVDLVSHLSEEVQQHYRAKADAVERAFRMLSDSLRHS